MARTGLKTVVGFGLVASLSVAAFAAEVKTAEPQKDVAGQAPAAQKPAVEQKGAAEQKTAAEDTAGQEGYQPKLHFTVPLFSPLFERFPVATVNDDPILMSEFKDAIAGVHKQTKETGTDIKKNYTAVLNRLITGKLFVAEAMNMGLDAEPEIKKMIDDYAEDHLRTTLKRRQVQDLKPDPKLVEPLYREAAQEWKIRSVKFDKEEDARAMAKELQGGAAFDAVANKLIDAGKVEGAKEASFVKPKELLQQVAGSVSKLKPGGVTPVIPIGPAFTIVKLEDIRYPADNAAALEMAQAKVMEYEEQRALQKFNQAMTKKWAKTNDKLLKSLDLEKSEAAFEKLTKDKRILTRIPGEKGITVGEFVQEVKKKFFHGIDGAIKEKKVNAMKQSVLANLIYRQAYDAEAKAQKIDKSDEYLNAVKKFRESILFGAFVQLNVAPDVKVKDEEVKAYYDEHIKDFTTSPMAKVQALVFLKQKSAEDAADKLRKGTDFDWVKNNAEAQLPEDKREDYLPFSGQLLSVPSFPVGLDKVLENAKAGDIKVHGTPEGYFYVVQVTNVFPATVSPFDAEKKGITKAVFGKNLAKAIDDMSDKLRKAYPVKVFLADGGK